MHEKSSVLFLERLVPYLLVPALLFFLSLLLYGFPDSAAPWFDEGINIGIASSWAEHGVMSMQIAPDTFVEERSLLLTTNFPVLGFVALSFLLFGVGLAQAKIVMILFLVCFVSLFFRFIDRHYRRHAAIVGLVIMVTFLPLYGNGKSVLGEVPGLAYLLGGLLLFEKQNRWTLFFSGLLFGLAATSKSLYLLLLPALFAGELWRAYREKRISWRRWGLLFLGMAPPLILWVYTLLPPDLNTEFFQRTLSLYQNPYKTEQAMIPNLKRFVTESTPFHFLFLFSIFLFTKITHRFRTLTPSEAVLGSFIFLNILFYLQTVGWYRYFFPAHLIAILLFTGALFELRERWPSSRLRMFGYLIVVALVLAQTATLFRHWQDPLYHNTATRLFAEDVRARIPPDASVFIVSSPETAVLIDHPKQVQYVETSPHLSVGVDLFASGLLPDYVIMTGYWDDVPYGKKYLSLENMYRSNLLYFNNTPRFSQNYYVLYRRKPI